LSIEVSISPSSSSSTLLASHAPLALTPTPAPTAPFPLHTSFLAAPLPKELLAPLLAFNSAAWRFRKPAQASRLVKAPVWIVDRLVELAHSLLQTIKPPKRKKVGNSAAAEASIDEHSKVVMEAGPDTFICYTDGSASPNPGPTGAGAVVYAQGPDFFYDMGKSLGFSTNNAAEIYAIGMLTLKLLDIVKSHPLVKRAVVFSDSKLAIGACASKVPPLANALAIRSLRKLLDFVQTKLKIAFYWIKGHAAVGGNERVDKLSKRFAMVQGNSEVVDCNGTFSCLSYSAPWAFGFPLADLPSFLFTSNLPVAPAIASGMFRRSLPAGMLTLPSVAIDVDTHSDLVSRSRSAGLRPRAARSGTRKSARLAALSDPVPHLGLSLQSDTPPFSAGDELDHKHCD
jgi:ribonuclease HI